MTGNNRRFCNILLTALIIALTIPAISFGASKAELGRDWYCSEPDEHTHAYKQHVKHHIDQAAEAMYSKLDTIYSDQSLTASEKKKRTIEILHEYLLKTKAGIGD